MPLVRKSASVTATPAGNTPALLPNLALWLDGADSSTLISDGAASFASASSQYLSCASNSTLQVGSGQSFLIAGWYKRSSAIGLIGLFGKSTGLSGSSEYLAQLGNNFQFNVYETNNTERIVQSSGGGNRTTWTFVSAWCDGSRIYCSVNNGSIASAGLSLPIRNNTTSFVLGNTNVTSGYFDGQLDSFVFLKNPTVSFTDLNTYLYNSGAGRRSSDFINSSLYSGSGAVSWWDLDERSGTRKDRIGTNDLTDNNSVGYASGIASGAVQYDGDPISQWNDKSGNNRHLTAPSASARPTYKTSQQNGMSTLLFDGVDDYLITNSVLSLTPPYTIFVALSIPGGAYTKFIIGNDNTDGPRYFTGSSGNKQDGILTNKNGGSSVNGTAMNIGSGYNLFTLRFNGSSSEIIVNGVSKKTGTTSNEQSNSKLSIGAAPATPNSSIYANISEILFYNINLGVSQRQLIEQYLIQKWMGTPVVTLTASSTIQHLEWSDVGFATRYEVYYRVTGSNTWTLYTTTTSLWAAVQNLTVGVSYDFRVDAVWSV